MTRILSLLLLGLIGLGPASQAVPPSPEDFLGHRVGEDRKLASYQQVLDYLRRVGDASDRVSIETAGRSTLDNEMVVVVMTSPANQRRLERYREISRRLARAESMSPGELEALVEEGRAVALVTCTIHSTEVGCTQMAMELAHQFATTEDPERLAWMEEVVLLLMPSINPDGQVMVVDWYNRHLGTEYEGGPMPWLYHPYVGHDNNRDFYMLTQQETRVVNEVLYHRWFPQVFVDEHQMGSTGARMFVPPQTDPLAAEIHSLIFRQADLIGTNMSFRLEEAGKTGVGHNMIFDSYWPGGTRNTAWWKNVTGLLTEVASARVASPLFIDPGELQGGSKGLPEYKRRANFPSPWPGGWWRLRDIIDYELVATWALLESSAQYRPELLRNIYRMGREATAAGAEGEPYAWIIPPDQHDPVAAGRLVELLLRHGIRILAADESLTVGRSSYPAGTHVVPAAQPYRSFLLTMLRPQRYPEVRPYVGGPILPPYDVTSWSLPISMGVEVVEAGHPVTGSLRPVTEPVWPESPIDEAGGGYLIPHSADSAYAAMNRLLAEEVELFWLPGEADDRAPGDIYIPPEGASPETLRQLVSELHLPIRPLTERPSGSGLRVRAPRVGLYKPWMASMDEGWTRWLLEQYEFDYINLNNDDIKESSFSGKVDVLVFPDVGKSVIARGEREQGNYSRPPSRLPPAYSGGIEPEGGGHLEHWVREGGTVVALDSSAGYLIDLFELPVTDVLADLDRETFYAPGTMLRIEVDTRHPLGFGLRPAEAAYFAGSPAFRTSPPDARIDRRVVARYPDHRDDIPVSGYIRGAERLERRAAVVEFSVGKGRVVLIGFRAQHRAQPLRTFKLLFNALYLPGLEEVDLGISD